MTVDRVVEQGQEYMRRDFQLEDLLLAFIDITALLDKSAFIDTTHNLQEAATTLSPESTYKHIRTAAHTLRTCRKLNQTSQPPS